MKLHLNAWAEIANHAQELLTHPAFRAHPIKTMVRSAMWPFCCVIGRPVTIHYRDPDFVMRVPAKFRSAGGTSAFLLREDYEPEYRLVARLLSRSMVFVDVGANAGAFSFAASKMVGEKGRVLAFEPGPNCFNLLSESVRLNQVTNVEVLNFALTNTRGEAEMFMHYGKENSFGLGASVDGRVVSIPIRTTTLRDVFQERKLSRLDFIKIDAEGAQELVIEGGVELVTAHRPTFLIKNNIGACRRLNLNPADCFGVLHDLGYRFASASKAGAVESIGCPEATHHVFCVPESRFEEFLAVCNANS